MDRETGPEPTPTGSAAPAEGPQGFPAPSRGTMAGLAADPRLPIWARRAIVSLLVLLIFTLWQNWRIGLTAAALVAIADTIYQSKTMSLIPAAARAHSAQRRSKRRLFVARSVGYLAVHAYIIPGTDSVIDHLVIGPGGVYALDSERWDRRLPVRTVASDSAAGPLLYHGPFSQKSRLAHARWAAAQASTLLSAELGRQIEVRPAMVIYGPTVPWAVTNLRGVDVFSGRKLIRYFRTRRRAAGIPPLTWEQAGEIYYAAQRSLPPG
ncbi:MAG: nuclease-related domain-containing protein [Streptosporangiaceae bacterium]